MTNKTLNVGKVPALGRPTTEDDPQAVLPAGQVFPIPFMGVPDNGNAHGFTNWDAWRIYDLSQVNAALAKGAQVIALTDGTAGATTAGATTANRLDDFLSSFYTGVGSYTFSNMTLANRQNVEIHYANGNELDKDSPNMTNMANTYELCAQKVANYAMASLWFDATASHVRDGTTDTFLTTVATSSGRKVWQMLDGLAGSYYTPGRQDYPSMTPSSYDPYSLVIDPYVALMNRYGITRASIWEYGIPILLNQPAYSANPGLVWNDMTKRPAYIEGMVHYWLQACLNAGITTEVCLYWDQQSGTPKGVAGNTNPDNRLVTDNGLVTPDSAHTWRRAGTTFVPA